MKVDVIIRTHDQSNIHQDRERYINVSKTALITGCLTSMINSANLVSDHEINFVILDDHSTTGLLDDIADIFRHCKWPMELISLDQPGYNYSALRQFELCRDSTAELVYSVEDDYLHCPSAFSEMISNYQMFRDKTGAEIAIYPFDMPDDYVPPWMAPCHLVHGTHRHWRSGTWTTQTMLARPELFRQHWPIFEKLALKYRPLAEPGQEHVHEGNTICEIWRNHALRFSPVPSLALHMQFDTQIDPYINWQQWWADYSRLN